MSKTALMCALVLLALNILAGASVAQTSAPLPFDEYTELAPNGKPVIPRTDDPQLRSGAALLGTSDKRTKGGDVERSRTVLTGFGDTLYYSDDPATRAAVMDETVEANGEVARIFVDWRAIAPANPSPNFDPTDPGSPEYSWGSYDAGIREASARGLRVIALVNEAPTWAEGPNRPPSAAPGSWKPNPADVADFGEAIASRYSGTFGSLPRVKDYMLWNEPNLLTSLTPQWDGTTPTAAIQYRRMLNAFYKRVKSVNRSNLVITGGTAPYGSDPGYYNIRPLQFWREVMCIKEGNRLKPTSCKTKAKFDILTHHPINTSGGPRTSAINPDDISTPDLHNLVDVLRAAERAGTLGTEGHHPVWATEFWWESNPPDPSEGYPSLAKQAKWYEEAIYMLWRQGASMVLPYQVRDDPYSGVPGRSSFETGIRFVDGSPKPAARAVAFPFVAERESKRKVLLWGIPPQSGRLTVTQKGKGGNKVAAFNVKSGKVFTKKVKIKGNGQHKLTAEVGGEKSLNWTLK